MDLETMWPPFALSVTARDENHEVRLRVLRDEDVAAIHGVRPEEIYGKDIPEYAFPWLFAEASPVFRWLHRAQMSPREWSLDFGVWFRGRLVGVVDMRAKDFARARAIETGSWMYHAEQGKGLGTLVRHAAVGLGFGYLGASTMATSWVVGNEASARVSAKVGYSLTGVEEAAQPSRGGRMLPVQHAVLRKEDYIAGPRVLAAGVTPALRRMLGA